MTPGEAGDARESQASPGASMLSIGGEMTIYRAQELKQALLAALDGPETTCHVDLSGVTEIDSAGVQLLMLVRQLARARGKAVRLVAHSPAVLEVLTLLHLASYLETPAENAS